MSLKKAAEQVRAQGRGKDTELVHLTKREVDAMGGLMAAAGARPTKNPKTGLPEFGFLDSLLPTILGVGANMILPGSGMVVGGLTGALQNKDDPLMGAVLGAAGGYGGANIANGLSNMGQASAIDNMITGAAKEALPSVAEATGQGAMQALTQPQTAVSYLGGPMQAAKNAGLAAAPMLYDYMMPQSGGDEGIPKKDEKGRSFDYDAGYTGGTMTGPDFSSERQWFNQTYTPRFAKGGEVHMESGGFVIPADVVSMAGSGSTDAGLAAFGRYLGAQPIKGPGDGQSDDIPARIDGKPVARVANGEAYVPRATVQKLGGAKKLYDMVERVREMAHGKREQQRPVDLRKALN